MKARHWTPADFRETGSNPASDGSQALNRIGYCDKCKGDMQSFGDNGKDGPLKHYNSHRAAKRLGIWGK